MHRLRHETAYVSMGSNVGDRRAVLLRAIELLTEHPEIEVSRVSSFYETEPQGVANQPWFLNAVARLSTGLGALELLAALQAVEAKLGRERRRESRWGPRTLDLDLLLLGEVTLTTEDLTIPHPRMWERRFVLEPLLEIAGDLRRPGSEGSVSEYLARVQSQRLRKVD